MCELVQIVLLCMYLVEVNSAVASSWSHFTTK